MQFPDSTVPLNRALDNCTRLRYRAQNLDPLTGQITYGLAHHVSTGSLQLCQWTTAMCSERGCKWCDYKLRSRHKRKLGRLGELISSEQHKWRFWTFTLPGTLYPVRTAGLDVQLSTMRSALTKFRDRQRDKRGSNPFRLGKVTGSYVIEHPYNEEKKWWHLHTHALLRVPAGFDDLFASRMAHYNRQWLECVDKERTRALLQEGVRPQDLGSPIDIEKVTPGNLEDYMTKATGYMAKGQGGSTSLKDEVSQVMRGRIVFNSWGDLRGTKYGRIKE
jgi:hypothetical protein